jgi:hypothetical protein
MNRRSLIAAIAGMTAAGPKVMTAAAAQGGLASLGIPALHTDTNPFDDGAECVGPSPQFLSKYHLIHQLERRQEALRWPSPMPPHISSKKSWSAVYKLSEARKEYEHYQMLIERLREEDEDTVLRLFKEYLW